MANAIVYQQTQLFKKDSLSHEVYNEILNRLMDNRLVPGTMLNRRDVAKELGVSVAPVLEAMLRLEIEGFLESVPRKGSFVKPVKREDVYGQFMVREALECQAARLYCGKPVQKNMNTLMKAAETLDNRINTRSSKGWEKEIHFHLSLIELADCPLLSQAFIKTVQLGLFYQLCRIIDEQPHPADKHVSLIQKLGESSPNESEKHIRHHLRSGKETILNIPLNNS